MAFANPADNFLSPQTFQKRLPIAVAVLALHAAFYAMLQIRQVLTQDAPQGEAILYLPTLPKEETAPDAAPAARQNSLGTFTPPATLPQTNAPELSVLSTVSACAPGNLSKLSFAERDRCRAVGMGLAGVVDQKAEILALTKSKNAARYEAEIRERNTPLRVPCTYATNLPDTGGMAVMVDLKCATGQILELLK